ncbi:MAG: hypothetical protein IT537_09750 [Hyphomicrobiales bacterium]|nr:hypothetical protein [Hyphomicrobiales bacterium]
MATATSSATEQQDKAPKSSSPIVIVDLEDPQTSQRVKQLRKGKGKLLTKVERIVSDLVEAGTVKATAQPVVIVVREIPASPFSFGMSDDDDDDED